MGESAFFQHHVAGPPQKVDFVSQSCLLMLGTVVHGHFIYCTSRRPFEMFTVVSRRFLAGPSDSGNTTNLSEDATACCHTSFQGVKKNG